MFTILGGMIFFIILLALQIFSTAWERVRLSPPF
ncbi:hypothetical protein CSUI_006524 [Cystoisospora suis]|uniref:Uncharacterized protein n=1 Tax=Cystoisospora suis TaxID=483139 RepID=A0A2C6KQ17_9APIC|nr:hypothetical protein CSUI_006524 [Cystoisospora suis]